LHPGGEADGPKPKTQGDTMGTRAPERNVPRSVTYTYMAYFFGSIALLLVALIVYAM
jgi:hypothetical protein